MRLHRITIVLAVALVTAALAVPVAHAKPFTTGAGGPDPRQISVPGPTVVVEADDSTGFDWGAAAIGAGLAAALMLLAAAGVTYQRHRHQEHGLAH